MTACEPCEPCVRERVCARVRVCVRASARTCASIRPSVCQCIRGMSACEQMQLRVCARDSHSCASLLMSHHSVFENRKVSFVHGEHLRAEGVGDTL
eukprot:6180887-Pleurochrysis_carterae.AAC.1